MVTTGEKRPREIERLVVEQNSSGLEFEVRLLEDIRKEVINRCG